MRSDGFVVSQRLFEMSLRLQKTTVRPSEQATYEEAFRKPCIAAADFEMHPSDQTVARGHFSMVQLSVILDKRVIVDPQPIRIRASRLAVVVPLQVVLEFECFRRLL
jgi:hypothetical protein